MNENGDKKPVMTGVCKEVHKRVDEKFDEGEKKFEKLMIKMDDHKDCISGKINRLLFVFIFVLGSMVANLVLLYMKK